MKTRKLGYTNLELSVIGLGAWAMGGGGWLFSWGQQDDKDSIDTILCAVEKGVNWIDTAAGYGLGHSEEVVGRAIKKLHNKIIIATKCSRIWDKKGNFFGRLKRESICHEIESSLKRLDIDVIDLYQIHFPEPDEDIEEAWDTIANLIKEGKIRYAGVSNFNVEQLKRIQPIHPVASLQPPYSMLQRDIENELLGYCAKNNIGVIVYSPLQKGLLTGKITKERIKNLPKDDHRRKDPQFKEPKLSINLEFVEGIHPIAKNNGVTIAQLAIAWVLRRPEVTSAIVGARYPSQIEETIASEKCALSKEDIKTIDSLFNKHQKSLNLL